MVDSSTYLAFRSFWIIPNEIPSVSSHIAKYPIPGIAILGCTTLPPCVEIFLEKSSTEGIILNPLKQYSEAIDVILSLRIQR